MQNVCPNMQKQYEVALNFDPRLINALNHLLKWKISAKYPIVYIMRITEQLFAS